MYTCIQYKTLYIALIHFLHNRYNKDMTNEDKIANYHTHTSLCKHATGMPEDYILQAKKDGCLALGFSDHAPFPLTMKDGWTHVRMSLEEIPLYVEAVKKAAHKADFPVYLGFETEWDKDYINWYKEGLISQYGAQYLVLGSHWLTKGDDHIYCQKITDKNDLFTYINQTVEAIQSGIFKFLAHPDVFMGGWRKWDTIAKSALQELLSAACSCNMCVEINGYGLNKPMVTTERGFRFQYPVEEFWEIVAKTDAKVICNSDAHESEVVIKNARMARNFAQQFGITPINLLDIGEPLPAGVK